MKSAIWAAFVAALLQSTVLGQQNPKVKEAFDKLDRAIEKEATRLAQAGKLNEFEDVSKLHRELIERWQPLLDQQKFIAYRKKRFVEELCKGEWVRPTFPDKYIFSFGGEPNAGQILAKAVGPSGQYTNEGIVVITGEDSAELRFVSGHLWKIYRAGNARLVVDEYHGPNRINDGILLIR